jgi:uncharacterized protein
MQSGWRDSVVAYIRAEARPIDKFGHQPRLYALATRIGLGMDYDDDVLFAAAWMHDLGVFIGHRPEDPSELSGWDHIPYTIERSRELLTGWGFPPGKLEQVEDAIRHHQAKDEPTALEAILLRDADILEQLGAIGAMRTVVKVGRDTRFPTFSSIIPVLSNAVNHLPGRISLATAISMAEPRVEMLRSFLTALRQETGELLD